MRLFENAEVKRSVMHDWMEIFCKRDFTKRQANILNFLLCLMIASQSYSVKIPMLSDFSLCGVFPNKIRAELEELVRLNVIKWNEDTNVFTINVNMNEWDVKVLDYDHDRLDYLMDINQRKEVKG